MAGKSEHTNGNGLEMDVAARIGSLPRIRDAIEGYSRRLGVPPVASYRMKLAVEEACSNVIRHSYRRSRRARRIHLEFEWMPNRISVLIRDFGRSFNSTKFPARTAARIALRSRARGGYGIHLIKSLVDKYSYIRVPSGENRLRLTTFY